MKPPEGGPLSHEYLPKTLYRDAGRSLVHETQGTSSSLVSLFAVRMLIQLSSSPILIDEELHNNFKDFYKEIPPYDMLAKAVFSEHEVFEGFLDELQVRGFIAIKTNTDSTQRTVEIEEQGRLEAELFSAFLAIKSVDEPELPNARLRYVLAAETRYNFWVDRAAQGYAIAKSERFSIAEPTLRYDESILLSEPAYRSVLLDRIAKLDRDSYNV